MQDFPFFSALQVHALAKMQQAMDQRSVRPSDALPKLALATMSSSSPKPFPPSVFALNATLRISGDVTPHYLYHPLVPGRVQETLPNWRDLRLLVLLRDPVTRAYSNYKAQRPQHTHTHPPTR